MSARDPRPNPYENRLIEWFRHMPPESEFRHRGEALMVMIPPNPSRGLLYEILDCLRREYENINPPAWALRLLHHLETVLAPEGNGRIRINVIGIYSLFTAENLFPHLESLVQVFEMLLYPRPPLAQMPVNAFREEVITILSTMFRRREPIEPFIGDILRMTQFYIQIFMNPENLNAHHREEFIEVFGRLEANEHTLRFLNQLQELLERLAGEDEAARAQEAAAAARRAAAAEDERIREVELAIHRLMAAIELIHEISEKSSQTGEKRLSVLDMEDTATSKYKKPRYQGGATTHRAVFKGGAYLVYKTAAGKPYILVEGKKRYLKN
jgi:hypothetical protein